MAPKDAPPHAWDLRVLVYLAKGTGGGGGQGQRTLRWEVILYYPGGPSLQPQGPYKRSKAEAADGMMAARAGDDFQKGPQSKERESSTPEAATGRSKSLPRTSPPGPPLSPGKPLADHQPPAAAGA